jgi:hypothetical protein
MRHLQPGLAALRPLAIPERLTAGLGGVGVCFSGSAWFDECTALMACFVDYHRPERLRIFDFRFWIEDWISDFRLKARGFNPKSEIENQKSVDTQVDDVAFAFDPEAAGAGVRAANHRGDAEVLRRRKKVEDATTRTSQNREEVRFHLCPQDLRVIEDYDIARGQVIRRVIKNVVKARGRWKRFVGVSELRPSVFQIPAQCRLCVFGP